MSDIMVKIGSIPGEGTLKGYEGQIECLSMRHAIELPVVVTGASRAEGASQHGPIELCHPLDKASPILRLAASAGVNLGKVTITRIQIIEGSPKPAEVITLNNAYAIRIDTDTPVDAVSGQPGEEPLETFSLEYSDITWDFKHYVNGVEKGAVQGSWSTAMQSINV
jgi:type VI secretion system Hcp family effector